MDIAALVSAGGAGMLAFGFAYLLRSNRADRQQYQLAVDSAVQRADAADQRARERLAQLEEERQLRYDAQEEAARLRGELAARQRAGER